MTSDRYTVLWWKQIFLEKTTKYWFVSVYIVHAFWSEWTNLSLWIHYPATLIVRDTGDWSWIMQHLVIFWISDIEVFAFIWFVHEPVIYQKAQSCISTKYVSKISIFYVIQYEGLWQHLTEILHWYAFWKSTGNQCNPQIIQYKKKERWHCTVGHNKVTIFSWKQRI